MQEQKLNIPMTELLLPAPGEFGFSYHLLYLSQLSPPTHATSQLAAILKKYLRTTIPAHINLPLIEALRHHEDSHAWIPFTEAEAKFICIHLDERIFLHDHPLNHSLQAPEIEEYKIKFMEVGKSLKDRWGGGFIDALCEHVRGFGTQITQNLGDYTVRRKHNISSFPEVLRKFLEGCVARGVASPLSIKLDQLLASSEPRLEERHLLYIVQLLEMVDPTWILGYAVPWPTDAMTEDFCRMFGELAMGFLEYYVKEDYARMEAKEKAAAMKVVVAERATEKKVIDARRLVKKLNMKVEKAVKRKEADSSLDISKYLQELDEAKSAVVKVAMRVQADEEDMESLAVVFEELWAVRELEKRTKSWYDELENYAKGLAKEIDEDGRASS